MINILIRTANRPDEFRKCVSSIAAQTYKDLNLIICTDHVNSIGYIKLTLLHFEIKRYELFTVEATGVPYHWNFYCNNLKERVKDGWFFYLDDDDWLIDKSCLERMSAHLNGPGNGIICQYNRGKKPKPVNLKFTNGVVNTESIILGKIGGSAIFLHHTHKNLADWDGKRAADYRFIKAIAEKLPLKFVKVVVVQTGNSGRHGK